MCAGDGHREAFPGEAVNAGTRKSCRSQGEEAGGVACVRPAVEQAERSEGMEQGGHRGGALGRQEESYCTRLFRNI